MTRRALARTGFAVVGSALALVPAAAAVDVNGDRLHDFVLREAPLYPNNVGANCDLFFSGGAWWARLYIRPPRVWGLPGLGRQRVRWRARFYDPSTARFLADGPWQYAFVGPKQYTDFGGGPDAPQVMLHWNQYWTGSQYYEHPQSDERPVRAIVSVGWYRARQRLWISSALNVRWQFSTANRTIGEGQLGPASTPITSWTC